MLRTAVMVARWTDAELSLIQSRSLPINVLEYFMAIYAIMSAGRSLAGRVVGCLIDNTTAMSWLGIGRASSHSVGGRELAKLFSLYCIQLNIYITPSYINTNLNVFADDLSRDISLQATHGLSLDNGTKDARWWKGFARQDILRTLLTRSVASPSSTPLPLLLELLARLLD